MIPEDAESLRTCTETELSLADSNAPVSTYISMSSGVSKHLYNQKLAHKEYQKRKLMLYSKDEEMSPEARKNLILAFYKGNDLFYCKTKPKQRSINETVPYNNNELETSV